MKQIQHLPSRENILLSKLKVTVIFMLLTFGAAHATTLEQLAKKNSELLELKAELELAKTRSELQKLRAPSPVAGLSPSESLVPPVRSRPAKNVNITQPNELDNVDFIGAGGDSANGFGKFIIGNSTILRRQGETINGWILVKVTANEANFAKLEKGEAKQKTIYLASVNRLSERRQATVSASPQGFAPIVPAITAQQPPLR